MRDLRQARPTALLALAAMLVTGCTGFALGEGTTTVGTPPYEQGSGTVASESRTVASFHAISAAEGVRVEVASGPTAVTVTTDDNLLGHVTTNVSNGVLSIDLTGSFQTHHAPKVAIAMPTPPDGLTASTGATIEAKDLGGTTLAVSSGTGATVRGAGTVDTLRVSASTGATADLRDLEASTADVDVTTGSSARINVSGAVTGTCTTGSTVRLHGAATTTGLTVDQSSSLSRE